MRHGDRQRAYRVQMYAISEERRVCGMTDEEYRRRCEEAYDNCFGGSKHDRRKLQDRRRAS